MKITAIDNLFMRIERQNWHFVKISTDEGISVSVPALPGCWSEGDTVEGALANIQDAIRDYLAALEDRFTDAEVREVEVMG